MVVNARRPAARPLQAARSILKTYDTLQGLLNFLFALIALNNEHTNNHSSCCLCIVSREIDGLDEMVDKSPGLACKHNKNTSLMLYVEKLQTAAGRK